MFDNTVVNGICSVCGKFYKNKTECINIALNLDDNKLYCKNCAIDNLLKELNLQPE